MQAEVTAAEAEWRELAERGTQALQHAKELQRQLLQPAEPSSLDVSSTTTQAQPGDLNAKGQRDDGLGHARGSATTAAQVVCIGSAAAAQDCCSEATTSDDDDDDERHAESDDGGPESESCPAGALNSSTAAPAALQQLGANLDRLEGLLQLNHEVQQLKSARACGGGALCPAGQPPRCRLAAARDSSSGAHSEAVIAPVQAAVVGRKLGRRMDEADDPDPEVYLGRFGAEGDLDAPTCLLDGAGSEAPAPLAHLTASLRARLPALRRRIADLERCGVWLCCTAHLVAILREQSLCVPQSPTRLRLRIARRLGRPALLRNVRCTWHHRSALQARRHGRQRQGEPASGSHVRRGAPPCVHPDGSGGSPGRRVR